MCFSKSAFLKETVLLKKYIRERIQIPLHWIGIGMDLRGEGQLKRTRKIGVREKIAAVKRKNESSNLLKES